MVGAAHIKSPEESGPSCLSADYKYKSIGNPIPKNSKHYPRVPISLLSMVCKLHSSILNNSLITFLDDQNILVEEQKGFRKSRACIDHIFSTCTIIRNILHEEKPTFACFIYFQKAFDFVNRDLLAYSLLKTG